MRRTRRYSKPLSVEKTKHQTNVHIELHNIQHEILSSSEANSKYIGSTRLYFVEAYKTWFMETVNYKPRLITFAEEKIGNEKKHLSLARDFFISKLIITFQPVTDFIHRTSEYKTYCPAAQYRGQYLFKFPNLCTTTNVCMTISF